MKNAKLINMRNQIARMCDENRAVLVQPFTLHSWRDTLDILIASSDETKLKNAIESAERLTRIEKEKK